METDQQTTRRELERWIAADDVPFIDRWLAALRSDQTQKCVGNLYDTDYSGKIITGVCFLGSGYYLAMGEAELMKLNRYAEGGWGPLAILLEKLGQASSPIACSYSEAAVILRQMARVNDAGCPLPLIADYIEEAHKANWFRGARAKRMEFLNRVMYTWEKKELDSASRN